MHLKRYQKDEEYEKEKAILCSFSLFTFEWIQFNLGAPPLHHCIPVRFVLVVCQKDI